MMEMSRGAETGNCAEQKGVVKTEVPTKVHWAKLKFENYNGFAFTIFTKNIVKLFLLNPALQRFILSSGPYWGQIIDLALIKLWNDFDPSPYVPIHLESTHVIFPKKGTLRPCLQLRSPLTHWACWHLCLTPSPTIMCKAFSLREDKYFVQQQRKALCQLRKIRKTTQNGDRCLSSGAGHTTCK